MKTIFSVILLLVAFGSEGTAITPSTPATYVEALQTANFFLWAWISRDADAGRRLISRSLSSKLQERKNEDWFRNYMVGISNPHHHSFEIGPGKEINSKRFSFPVILYEYYSHEPRAFRYKSRIEIIQENDSWRVDSLPITSDNQ